jgi:hypothetical protein
MQVLKNHFTRQGSLLIFSIILLMYHTASGQGLIISSGVKFIADSGKIVLIGNLISDGSFTNTGTVVFSGTAQTIGGITPVVFNNLTVSPGSNTTIVSSGQSVKAILLCNGTLNSNGNMTLLSVASKTALIDGAGSGQVYGNVTIQRYLPSGFGYKYFSSPFQGAKVSQFSNEINLSATYPPVYRYNENRVSSGWVNYSYADSMLKPMVGYTVNFGPAIPAITADITGVVSNGSVSLPLYNHNYTYTKGFSLVGNPFPSPVDWNAVSGWTKTNIDNALYYFKSGTVNQYTGTYSTYIGGVSSDGVANNIIPTMQAFFVHVTDGTWPVTGALAMNSLVRITDMSHPFLKSALISSHPFLRISANFEDNPETFDPTVVYFVDNATTGFDGMLDALKLMNTDQMVPSLYSIATDGRFLSINALPVPAGHMPVVPLGIKTARNGSISFRLRAEGDLPAGTQIYVSDGITSVNHYLDSNGVFNIYLVAGDYNGRFSIVFQDIPTGISENTADNDLFKIYSSNGKLSSVFNLVPGGKGTFTICNTAGQILFRKEIFESGYYEFGPELKTGIYFATCVTGKLSETKKIFIQAR